MAKFCHQCGAQLDDDAVFCMGCGARQVDPAQPSAPQADPAGTWQEAYRGTPTPPAPKKKKTGLIAAIVAAVAVLALAAVAVFWVWPSFFSAEARYDKYMERGDTALMAEQYADACEAYGKAIDLALEQADPYVGRGDANLALEAYDDAIADYEAAMALDPERSEIYLKLADAYVADGDEDSARTVLRDGIEATGGNSKLEARLEELTPRADLADALSGAADLLENTLSGSALIQGIDADALTALTDAMANTAQATEQTLSQSPYAALGTFASALMQGQISLSVNMADETNALSAQVDLCTDLENLEASLSGSLTANGQTVAGEAYAGPEFAAFHSDLVDREWYGVTWSTLLDDLENSIFVENGTIAPEDIQELRTELDAIYGAADSIGSLDFSGIDLNRYLTLLLAIEPTVTTGTESDTGRSYVTASVPFSTFAGVAAEVLDTLANDTAAMELFAQILEMGGQDATEVRTEWQSELSEAAEEFRTMEVGGSVELTFYMANGYLDSVLVSGNPTVDGETVTVSYVLSFEYENDTLRRFDCQIDMTDGYGETSNMNLYFESAIEQSGLYFDRLSFQMTDSYGVSGGSIQNTWDRTTGEISTTVRDLSGYGQAGSLDYILRADASGAELSFDTLALTGVEGSVVLAAYPGAAYVTRPTDYVNLDEWDETFLAALESAGEQVGALFGGGSAASVPMP